MAADATNARRKDGQLGTRAKIGLYTFIFAAGLGLKIVQLKTGISLGRFANHGEYAPQPWPDVWAQLPGALPAFVFVFLVVIVVLEWKTIRRKMKNEESER